MPVGKLYFECRIQKANLSEDTWNLKAVFLCDFVYLKKKIREKGSRTFMHLIPSSFQL